MLKFGLGNGNAPKRLKELYLFNCFRLNMYLFSSALQKTAFTFEQIIIQLKKSSKKRKVYDYYNFQKGSINFENLEKKSFD